MVESELPLIVCELLAALGVVLFLAGVLAMVSRRGVATYRAGPVRQAERSLDPLRGQATVSWHRGRSVEFRSTARYTPLEILEAVQRGDVRTWWPPLTALAGVGMLELFGGLALVQVPGGAGMGAGLLLFFVGHGWIVARIFLRARGD